MSKINTDDLIDLIIDAIKDEPYFTKEVLKPKIKMLIKAFRLKTGSVNYSKSLSENAHAKLIRSNELHNLEKDFWKQELKKIVGNDNMQKYYDLVDVERLKWE